MNETNSLLSLINGNCFGGPPDIYSIMNSAYTLNLDIILGIGIIALLITTALHKLNARSFYNLVESDVNVIPLKKYSFGVKLIALYIILIAFIMPLFTLLNVTYFK